MSEKVEASGAKSFPIMVQSEGGFNTGITLTESNYDVWSQLMKMLIAEREKLSYIQGKKAPPAESEYGYEKWYAENQKRYLRLPTTQEIWNALSKAFYNGNGAFEQVQGDILRTDPIPDLEECYALVRRETVRQTTLKGECDTSDISAMVAQRLKTSNSNANPVDKSSLKCTHYMMYFSSESELQGENHQEIQTLTYDNPSEFINQEVGELDLGGMNLESTGSALPDTEEMIEEGRDSMTQSSSLSEQHGSEEALADIPNQSSSIEDILNLEYESSRKQLPHRHTRGIPKPIYEPELSSRVRYPMISLVSSCIILVSNI
ncbi:hypothetical protein ACOSQ2_004129 [Xanthoceras sorbifolium]